MTTHNTVELHYVTDDPAMLADLMSRADTLGSDELADYAIAQGMTPPGYEPGVRYAIFLAWPPGAEDGDGVLLWNTSKLGDDGEPADEDEDGDPWTSAHPGGA